MDEAKRERKGARLSATIALKTANELLTTRETFSEHYEADVQASANILREKLRLLEAIDSKILPLLQESEIDKEVAEAHDYVQNIHRCIARLEQTTLKSRAATPTPTHESSFSGAKASVKLPKINIQPFSGEPLDYQTFIQSFESSVDSNEYLEPVQKFIYLKGFLRGKALSSIEGISITGENYSEALDILKNRFGDTKLLTSTFIDALLKLKSVDDAKDVRKLRELYDKIEQYVRNLKSLGIDSTQFGAMLIPIILHKVPEDIRLVITKSIETDNWDFDAVLKSFHNELSAREKCNFVSSPSKPSKERSTLPPTATALHASGGRSNPVCIFCQQDHKAWNCTVVTDPQVRKQMVSEQKRCFNCLKTSHQARNCHSKYKCYKCKGLHNSSLCDKGVVSNVSETGTSDNSDETFSGVTTAIDQSVLLQTARVNVSNAERDTGECARLLFDNASGLSYITRELSDRLNLTPLAQRRILINGFGSQQTHVPSTDIVELYVKTTNGERARVVARVVEQVCAPLANQPIRLAVSKYPHLRGIPLADSHDNNDSLGIDILIGGDHFYQFMTDETKRGPDGPVAVKTRVGWVVGGPLQNRQVNNEQHANIAHTLLQLPEQLEKFWDLETLGIVPHEQNVHEEFENSIEFNGIQYDVKLPWKPSHPALPDNYRTATNRLNSTLTRLRKSPDLLSQYSDIISEQLSEGIVEKVPETTGERVHYLPHQPVVRETSETTKLRIVQDASSKASKNDVSLNECLFKGPSMNPELYDVLCRFRTYPTAFTSDLQKAFLQIQVNERDRDALRFLWKADPQNDDSETIFLRFTRVLFGLNCSPFLLTATLRHHLARYSSVHPDIVKRVVRSLYVDDLLSGGTNAKSTSAFYLTAKAIFNSGAFRMHKFVTNDNELKRLVAKSESISESEPSTTKALGVGWDTQNDNLYVDFADVFELANRVVPTKRNILRTVAMVYDPLGLAAPVTMLMKLVFQEACMREIAWDAVVPSDIERQWKRIINNLNECKCFTIPRLITARDTVVETNLHGFGDASTKGYAAVIYLQQRLQSGTINCKLITSKTRVAPKFKGKRMTDELKVPRLELLACLIVSRLLHTIQNALSEELQINASYLWTDSTINLSRIRGVTNEYKQFVENRLREIRTKTEVKSWYYVPTELNPADIPSRGSMLTEIAGSEMWLNGPDFLRESNDEYMRFEPNIDNSNYIDCEISASSDVHATLVSANDTTQHANISSVIDIERFSTIHKLLRATCYVLRFIKHSAERGDITVSELTNAKTMWVRDAQRVHMRSDAKRFKTIENNLKLFKDESDTLRCKGRIENAVIPINARHPIYLPTESPLTRLLILQAHANVMHSGVNDTLNNLRSEYWVPQGRRMVRKILRRCVLCRRYEGLPYTHGPLASLPVERLEIAPAFTNVGVDFAGPLLVRQIYTRSSVYKCWVAVFTCASTRAVHFELVPDLQATTFIRCMTRVFSRRGFPRVVMSDNATTFQSNSTRAFAIRYDITWKFILERSPRWGGFWERLIGLLKRLLKKTMRAATLTYEELETVLVQVEGVMNSRPLTYVGDDIAESLTPMHLSLGRSLRSIAPADANDNLDKVKCGRRYRYLQTLVNQFWLRFKQEYLTQLRERETVRQGSPPNMSVGDVVLIKEAKMPRCSWRLARITRLIATADGVNRGASLRLANGSTLNRPINLLYPLELGADDALPAVQPTRRSTRRAAATGELVRRLRYADENANDGVDDYDNDDDSD